MNLVFSSFICQTAASFHIEMVQYIAHFAIVAKYFS